VREGGLKIRKGKGLFFPSSARGEGEKNGGAERVVKRPLSNRQTGSLGGKRGELFEEKFKTGRREGGRHWATKEERVGEKVAWRKPSSPKQKSKGDGQAVGCLEKLLERGGENTALLKRLMRPSGSLFKVLSKRGKD